MPCEIWLEGGCGPSWRVSRSSLRVKPIGWSAANEANSLLIMRSRKCR